MTIPIRSLAVILAIAFALAAPAIQAATGWGLTAQAFAASGDTTLRAAGYAFSIWGVIYLALGLYGAYQVLPRNQRNATLVALAWPSAVAIAGCGAWIVAAAFDARWVSVGIIVLSAAVLILALLRAGAGKTARFGEWLLVWWPLGLLAGWLTIAAAINVLTVLTAEGLIPPSTAPLAAAAGVLAITAIAAGVLQASRLLAYGAPVVWGLVAVWVAERGPRPLIAWLALACAVGIGLYAAWLARPNAGRR